MPHQDRPQSAIYINNNSPQHVGLVGWWPLIPTYDLVEILYRSFATPGSSNVNADFDTAPSLWYSRLFDSANKYYDIGSNYQPSLPLSMSAWVNLVNTTARGILATCGGATNYAGAQMQTGAQFACQYGSNTNVNSTSRRTKTGTTNLSTGVWYLVSCSIRGATDMSLYVNGVDDGGTYSGTGGGMVNTGTGRVGTAVQATTGSARMTDVRLYNRDMTDDEHWNLHDPTSRFDLYYVPRRKIWSFGRPAAAGGTRQQTLSLLGVGV